MNRTTQQRVRHLALGSCTFLLLAAGVAQAAPTAITVPWIPSAPAQPHDVISGYSHTLKGVCKNCAGGTFQWDFGLGGGSSAVTAVNANGAYNLGVRRTYNCTVGDQWVATLRVKDMGGAEHTATYPMRCKDAGNGNPSAPSGTAPTIAQADVRINVAIDEALWRLHTGMSRVDPGPAAPYNGQPYGFISGSLVPNCTPLEAFELHGSKLNGNQATDPYVEDVVRLHNWILPQYFTSGISCNGGTCPAGGPPSAGRMDSTNGNRPCQDMNCNGFGLTTAATGGAHQEAYIEGICGAALAADGCPNCTILVDSQSSPNAIKNRQMKHIVQDIADYWFWGQMGQGQCDRGGWFYGAQQGCADGSTAGWPLLTLLTADQGHSVLIPSNTKNDLSFWTAQTQNVGGGSSCGGLGYRDQSNILNEVKTANGMFNNFWMGRPQNHLSNLRAEGFMYRHWYAYDGCWTSNLGNSYNMYPVMKSHRLYGDLTIENYDCNGNASGTPFDWYYNYPLGGPGSGAANGTQEGLASNLIKRQTQDMGARGGAYWNDNVGACNQQSDPFSTGWDVLILLKGVATIPPTAVVCDCQLQQDPGHDINQSFPLDGNCSFHSDINRTIVSYEWDFNYNSGAGFQGDATGATVTNPGYGAYGTYNIALRVTDDNPGQLGGAQTDLTVCQVRIVPPPHCPAPDAGGGPGASYDGFVGVGVTFAGSAIDPNNDPMTFTWIATDGAPVCTGLNTLNPSCTYNTPGTFTVELKVCDIPQFPKNPVGTLPCCKSSFATVKVGCHDPISNPGGPYTCVNGQTINLNGTGSQATDPGNVLTYGWDLNNDGSFSDSTAPIAPYPCNGAPGSVFSVCLRVTENPCLTQATKCTTVTVLACGGVNLACCPNNMCTGQLSCVNNTCVAVTPPTCNAKAAPPSQECTGSPTTFQLDGSGSHNNVGGQPLTYQWSVNCTAGSSSVANPSAQQTSFSLNASGCGVGCVAHLKVNNGTFTTECDSNPVTQVDTTNPSISCPAPTTAECQSNNQAQVNPGNANASDTCNQVSVTNAPSGSYALGTTQTNYSATDTCNNSNNCQSSVTVKDTTSPDVQCPAPITAECQSNDQAQVCSPNAMCSDSCSPATNTNGPQGCASYPRGTTTNTFTCADPSGNMDACQTTVTVQDTTAPIITCPGPTTVECLNDTGCVQPPASSCTDACSSTTQVQPAADCFSYSAPGPTTHTTSYSCYDATGNSSSCDSSVVVVDTTPPVVTVPNGGVASYNLWPPNHKMETIEIREHCGITVVDACEGSSTSIANVAVKVTRITSDENIDAGGGGDGNTSPDVMCVDNDTVQLRRERQGGSDGRVYKIYFVVTDQSGNTTPGTCRIDTTHSGNGNPAVDSGENHGVNCP